LLPATQKKKQTKTHIVKKEVNYYEETITFPHSFFGSKPLCPKYEDEGLQQYS